MMVSVTQTLSWLVPILNLYPQYPQYSPVSLYRASLQRPVGFKFLQCKIPGINFNQVKKKYEYGGYIILYMEMALSLTHYHVKLISIFKTPLTISHFKSLVVSHYNVLHWTQERNLYSSKTFCLTLSLTFSIRKVYATLWVGAETAGIPITVHCQWLAGPYRNGIMEAAANDVLKQVQEPFCYRELPVSPDPRSRLQHPKGPSGKLGYVI